METHRKAINSSDELTFEFDSAFSAAPAVAISFEANEAESGDVNVWVHAVSTTQITVRASAPVTGIVAVQAVVMPE